ncbi:MAG: sulfotransferase [Cyanophyceae cyanobacterium]
MNLPILPKSSSKERLIFVVGNSRSGTTLLGKILGLNPDVFTFEELHFFEKLWTSKRNEPLVSRKQAEQLAARLLSIQDEDFISQKNSDLFLKEAKNLVDKIPHKEIDSVEVFKTFLLYLTTKNGKSIPCEQTPRNIFYVTEILDFYPESRIINMIRDPRDVLLSQKYKWRLRSLGATNIPRREAVRSWCNYHPVTISKLWNASVNAANKFSEHPRVNTIKFEDLVANPQKIVQEICNFLEIEYQKEMLEVAQNSSHKKRNRERKGIDANAVGRWKNGELSNTEIFICQKITHSNMDRYNYPSHLSRPSTLSLSLSYLFLPTKLMLALMLNLRRSQNIVNAIKRRL